MNSSAVYVSSVEKKFRLYKEKHNSLKATLTNLRRSNYEEFVTLDNVSFEIKPGTSFGVVGSNGSGKSTLLKLLAGVITPDSGQIRVNGRVVALLELGAGFHPELTGRENIYLNAAILGMSRREIDTSFDEIVEFSELRDFIDVPIKHYSSGMVVRLGFSVAVHVDPEVLIIDEVLSVGDESFQKKSLARILDFKYRGKTIIIVSHELATIEEVCDRVLWLHDGTVAEIGPPEIVVENYRQSQRRKVTTTEATKFSIDRGDIIRHVTVSDGVDNNSGVFSSGTALQFNIVIRNHFPVTSVYLVICVQNDLNQIVWQNHESALTIISGSVETEEMVISCHIPRFCMREGIFKAQIRMHDSANSQLIESWGQEIKFNVIRHEKEDYGFLHVDANWNI